MNTSKTNRGTSNYLQRYWKWILGIILLSFSFNLAQEKSNQKESYEIGFSKKAFLNFSIQDGKAAAKVLAQKIFENQAPNYEANITVFENLQLLKSLVSNDKLHLVTLTSPDYYVVKDQLELTPFCVPVFFGDQFSKLILVVKKGNGINNLKSLKNKKIIVFANTDIDNSFALMWIDNILMKEFNETSKTYFSEIKLSSKTSEVVLPVFFDKYDACIITEGLFDVQSELNPQIKTKLDLIRESDKFIIALVCFTKKGNKIANDEVVDAFLNLHKTQQGKQLLSVFRADKIIPYKEEYLMSVEKIIDENKKLKKQLNSR